MTNSKPTDRDTKAVILKKYDILLDKLKDQSSNSMNVEETVRTEKNTNIVNEVSNKMGDLSSFAININDSISDFTKLTEAISVKQTELKNLFDIEAEALTLAALVDSNTEIKAQFDEEASKRRTDLQTDLDNLRSDIEAVKNDWKIERSKSQSEWDYSFNRVKIQKQDELNDKLAKLVKESEEDIVERRKELDIIENDLSERINKVIAVEDETIKLKEEVESIPTKIADAVKSAVGKATGMLTSKFEADKKYFERDISASLELERSKVESLTTELVITKNQIETLQTKLETAYGKLETMAIKTVEGAGNSNMFNEMKTLLTEKQGK